MTKYEQHIYPNFNKPVQIALPFSKKKVYSYKQNKKPWISTGIPTACQTKEILLRMIEG